MIDLAEKARLGRLVALGLTRNNGAHSGRMVPGGGQSRSSARPDTVIFFSRRTGGSTLNFPV